MKKTLRVAIIQEKCVYLNLTQSLEKAETLIKKAVEQGAELIVFGETWLCGYPAWLDYCPNVALWNHEPTKMVFAQMHQSSVIVPSQASQQIGEWARTYNVVIGIGINEKVEQGAGQGTIYNSFLLFDSDGQLLIHHRKLMPTYTEKLLYGLGNAQGLKSAKTAVGQIGGLICWEHWMPLTRQALHNTGEVIHIALWPAVHEMHQLASRHYAFEGRCFVIAVGQLMQVKDIPRVLDLPNVLQDDPDRLLLNGGSCIIAPDGSFELPPQFEQEGIIIHEIKDLEKAYRERLTLDVTGHYQRPDIFDFKVK